MGVKGCDKRRAEGDSLHSGAWLTEDSAFRKVGDVNLAVEGKHVMLAHRVDGYVLDDNEIATGAIKKRITAYLARCATVA